MSITYVQGNGVTSGSGAASVTCNLPSGVGQGNLLIASTGDGGAAGAFSPPDASWTQVEINTVGGTGNIQAAIWYMIVDAGHAGNTSFTFTPTTASGRLNLIIEEWHATNGWASNPLDQVALGNTGTAQATTITSGTTATTGQAEELWVANLMYKGGPQTETGLTSGWTKDIENGVSGGIVNAMLYKVASVMGTAACQYTIGTAEYWAGAVATFKDNTATPNPVLATSPSSLTFSAAVGGANPVSQNSTLSETAGVGTAWTSSISYGSGAGWLSISPSSGTLAANGSATITVSPTTGALAAGTYTATVTFTATTGGATDTITVTFSVTSSAGLSTSPSSLTFSDVVGGSNPANQTDTLSEVNGVATAWTSSLSYGSGSGWLSISPTSGSLGASGNTTVTYSVATGALAAGTYSATVTYTATTGGAVATVTVTFNVLTLAAPSPSPTVMTFSGVVGQASPPAQNNTLTNSGQTAGNWSTSISYGVGSGWLVLTPGSGAGLAGGAQTTVGYAVITGALTAGTYTATVTYTIGSNTATVSVTFILTPPPPPPPPTAFTIKLAGQDITQYVDQLSIKIVDTLGQGPGAGNSGATQGRASTATFNTNLGPMNHALGAGQPLPSPPYSGYVMRPFSPAITITATTQPALVRQGELLITDASGTAIFGGFATKFTDTTTSVLGMTRQNFTTLEAIDYSTSLQRTIVNETFSAATDTQIISFVMGKYAPWISLKYLPANPSYTFPAAVFHNQTVEQVIQTIAGITGFLVFVDYLKNLHYVSPTTASSAPFNLSDDPDFVSTFTHAVESFVVDDNSAINRVYFYGGTKLSNNFWQDISPLANGNNTVFTLAYSPTTTTDGSYHATVSGVDQVVGTANGTSPANTFKSQGGLADALVDAGARNITFGVAPPTGATVLVEYRYSFPLSLAITDENSHAFFGPTYLDGSIDDSTVFDLVTGIQRCKVLLSQQSYGLVTLKVTIYKGGVQAGMVLNVKNTVRGINGTYLVQEVDTESDGGGNFTYHITLGAWNWNLIDFLLKIPTLATFADDQTNEFTEVVTIEPITATVKASDLWAKKTSTQGVYYARVSPVGDGHDAFPGFATITS